MGNYYETELKFNYSRHRAFEKAVAILDFLEWGYRLVNSDIIVARTNLSAFGLGEELKLSFTQRRMIISSESRNFFQAFDMGKNESTVAKFVSIYKRATLPFNKDDFADEKPRSFIGRFLSGR
jgi:hypothetical protein